MGLLPGIAARQLDERGMVFVNDRGRQIARVPTELFDGRGPVADIEITRGDLNEVLLGALAELSSTSGELHYRYDDWVTEVDQDADGVAVTFASGASERFDLVVGADGLHSAMRERVFGPEERLVEYLGGYISFFTIPTPADTGVKPGWVAVHAMPGGSMLAARPDPDPATSNAIVIMRFPAVAGLRGDVAAQQRLAGVHTLRYSAATAWLDAGVHIKAVGSARHSSISITGDISGHSSDATTRAAIDGLSAALGR